MRYFLTVIVVFCITATSFSQGIFSQNNDSLCDKMQQYMSMLEKAGVYESFAKIELQKTDYYKTEARRYLDSAYIVALKGGIDKAKALLYILEFNFLYNIAVKLTVRADSVLKTAQAYKDTAYIKNQEAEIYYLLLAEDYKPVSQQDTINLVSHQDTINLVSHQDTINLVSQQDTINLYPYTPIPLYPYTINLVSQQDTINLNPYTTIPLYPYTINLVSHQDTINLVSHQDTINLVFQQDTINLVFYTVQLGVGNINFDYFNKVNDVKVITPGDGIKRFVAGRFITKESALEFRQKVIELGYTNAFIRTMDSLDY